MDEVMNKSYDPGNRYSCPYFWGTVGILYDTTVVDPADLQEGWDLLRIPNIKEIFTCMILSGIPL